MNLLIDKHKVILHFFSVESQILSIVVTSSPKRSTFLDENFNSILSHNRRYPFFSEKASSALEQPNNRMTSK